jgi:hypothetical protein
MANGKELVKQAPTALAPAPDYLKSGSRRGMEHMHQEDMLIPRLALAQALSPQVTEGDPRRVADLKPGDLFNSVTGQRYGRDVRIQVLRVMPLRAMEFNSIENGGGVKDPNVPLNDERLKWIGDSKPVATLFRDYIALLLPSNEIIALSFKSSGIKVARTLNGLMAFRNRDIFTGQYKITTDMMLVPKPHWIYKVENDGWVSQEQAAYGEQMFEAAAGLQAENIQREAVDESEDYLDAAGNDRVGPEM